MPSINSRIKATGNRFSSWMRMARIPGRLQRIRVGPASTHPGRRMAGRSHSPAVQRLRAGLFLPSERCCRNVRDGFSPARWRDCLRRRCLWIRTARRRCFLRFLRSGARFSVQRRPPGWRLRLIGRDKSRPGMLKHAPHRPRVFGKWVGYTRTVNTFSVRSTGRYIVSRSTGSRPAYLIRRINSPRRMLWFVVAPASW